MGGTQSLSEYVKDKAVLIIGNSTTVFDSPVDTTPYDVVVRLNKGNVLTSEQKDATGTRQEVYCGSGPGYQPLSNNLYTPMHTCYMSPKGRPVYAKPTPDVFYDEEAWSKLSKELGGARPSTGVMVVDMLLPHTQDISVVGFNSENPVSFYNDSAGPHDYEAEHALMQQHGVKGL